jgi:CheY-like chemotaxis protein
MPTALIVEDEPEANRLLAMLVQLRGYRTESAFTGGEALEKVELRPPDIVFLDLMLPDINGYEVCKSLKTRKATSLIPVVMVTARIAAENRLQSFRVGADEYIPKPYTPDQIFRAMADADAWRRLLEREAAEGEIRIDRRDEGESLRRIAQFRSLLVGRTTLALDAVHQVSAALKEIQASAEAWSLSHPNDLVATLTYRVLDDRVVLSIRSLVGWLKDLVRGDAWSRRIVPPFDEVVIEDSGDRVELLKAFPSNAVNGAG